jgi:hypothetical protein
VNERQFVRVGSLQKRLDDEAVDEIVAWLDQVYNAKAEVDALRVFKLLR